MLTNATSRGTLPRCVREYTFFLIIFLLIVLRIGFAELNGEPVPYRASAEDKPTNELLPALSDKDKSTMTEVGQDIVASGRCTTQRLVFVGDSVTLRLFKDTVLSWAMCLMKVHKLKQDDQKQEPKAFAFKGTRSVGPPLHVFGGDRGGSSRLLTIDDVFRIIATLPLRVRQSPSSMHFAFRNPTAVPTSSNVEYSISFHRALFAADVNKALLNVLPVPAFHRLRPTRSSGGGFVSTPSTALFLGFGAWDLLRPTKEVHGFEWSPLDTLDDDGSVANADEVRETAFNSLDEYLATQTDSLERTMRKLPVQTIVIRTPVPPNCSSGKFSTRKTSTASSAKQPSTHVSSSFCAAVLKAHLLKRMQRMHRDLAAFIAQRQQKILGGVEQIATVIDPSDLLQEHGGPCLVGDGVHLNTDIHCRRAEQRSVWRAFDRTLSGGGSEHEKQNPSHDSSIS